MQLLAFADAQGPLEEAELKLLAMASNGFV